MTISVKGLEINACHGVFESEKKIAQKFIFDVEIEEEYSVARASDKLLDTINYAAVCEIIQKTATENCFDLIEKLATECAFAIIEKFDNIEKIEVCVHKPQAPLEQKVQDVSVKIALKKVLAYLSLGSSMGDRYDYLNRAIEKISKIRGVKLKKVSPYFESEPYGGVAKNKFLNCAAEISTFLPPLTLLDELQKIELGLGRVREIHWDDRTIDIDIIFYGDEKICNERLIVPHPDYKNREFVLKPLKSIAPHKLT